MQVMERRFTPASAHALEIAIESELNLELRMLCITP
ncbi:hypothetical protein SAMN06295888_12028 [Desulfonatronum zhilinae]|nr:hypothetical protein SAMN06295888_12028 [Desulfonatronum zhilinae]